MCALYGLWRRARVNNIFQECQGLGNLAQFSAVGFGSTSGIF
jgi:hypothetical protein